jgi:hypothetical protein
MAFDTIKTKATTSITVMRSALVFNSPGSSNLLNGYIIPKLTLQPSQENTVMEEKVPVTLADISMSTHSSALKGSSVKVIGKNPTHLVTRHTGLFSCRMQAFLSSLSTTLPVIFPYGQCLYVHKFSIA